MSRTSEYGNLINKLAPWVFGGDYGDISNLLNKRERGYEELEQQRLQNDSNEMKLDEQRRQRDLEGELRRRDIFGGNDEKPATLRDMYGRVRDVAMELGSYEDVIKMQEKIDAIERQQNQDELAKQYKEALIGSANRRGTGVRGSSGSKRVFQLENEETGEKGVFLADEANRKLEEGWTFYQKEDPFDREMRRRREEAASKSEDSNPFDLFRGKKPAEDAIKAQKQATEDLKDKAPGAKAPARSDIQVPPGYELRKDKAGNPVLVKLRKG